MTTCAGCRIAYVARAIERRIVKSTPERGYVDSTPDRSWADLDEWWVSELRSDEAYEKVVTPLLLETLDPQPNHRYVDLGCGEGRVMRSVRARGTVVYGLDLNERLLRRAGQAVVKSDLPHLPVGDRSVDGAYAVLVLEHLADHREFFGEAARVTKPNGVLALIANHPIWTAPDSTPITDSDGEVLWRSGDYFGDGTSEIPTKGGNIVFYHRTMSELLNSAAGAGWTLENMIERPHHNFKDQAGIPRLLACRWCLETKNS